MIESLLLLIVDDFYLFEHAPVLLGHSLGHLQVAFVVTFAVVIGAD